MDSEVSVRRALASVYAEVMWLAKRRDRTAANARAWYTHIVSGKLARRIRQFSGMVSRKALREGASLRLEHFSRMQTMLTQLVKKHRSKNLNRPSEFISLVLNSERVHIVTRMENYAAMKAKGNYGLAGIKLVHWKRIPSDVKKRLWKRMLRGRVANARRYAPK